MKKVLITGCSGSIGSEISNYFIKKKYKVIGIDLIKSNIKNFKKFQHKIKYTIANFNKEKPFTNHQWGESIIEQHQRNNILNGIKDASDNDLIIISDSDEIPDLNKLNQINKND